MISSKELIEKLESGSYLQPDIVEAVLRLIHMHDEMVDSLDATFKAFKEAIETNAESHKGLCQMVNAMAACVLLGSDSLKDTEKLEVVKQAMEHIASDPEIQEMFEMVSSKMGFTGDGPLN